MLYEDKNVQIAFPPTADKLYETTKQINENNNSTTNSLRNDYETLQQKHTEIIMSNVTAKWTDGQINNSIENINLIVKPEWLLAIIGPVGAGKVYTIIITMR